METMVSTVGVISHDGFRVEEDARRGRCFRAIADGACLVDCVEERERFVMFGYEGAKQSDAKQWATFIWSFRPMGTPGK